MHTWLGTHNSIPVTVWQHYSLSTWVKATTVKKGGYNVFLPPRQTAVMHTGMPRHFDDWTKQRTRLNQCSLLLFAKFSTQNESDFTKANSNLPCWVHVGHSSGKNFCAIYMRKVIYGHIFMVISYRYSSAEVSAAKHKISNVFLR